MLTLHTTDGGTWFKPGELIEGRASWHFDEEGRRGRGASVLVHHGQGHPGRRDRTCASDRFSRHLGPP